MNIDQLVDLFGQESVDTFEAFVKETATSLPFLLGSFSMQFQRDLQGDRFYHLCIWARIPRDDYNTHSEPIIRRVEAALLNNPNVEEKAKERMRTSTIDQRQRLYYGHIGTALQRSNRHSEWTEHRGCVVQ